MGGSAATGGSAGAGGAAGGTPPGISAPSYFHAGTRLKPRVLRGGGLEVLDRTAGSPWYDAELGDWCVFRTGDDGVERCYPEAGQNDLFDEFLDRSCTKPVLTTAPLRCEDNRSYQYVSVGPNNGTGCGSVTYRIGAPIPAGTPLYSGGAGNCMRVGSSTATVWPLEKVRPDTFVAVERVSRPGPSNLDAWVRQGADGSWEVIGFYDPVRKAPCSGLGPEVSSDVCVPDWVEATATFSDSSCSRRVALGPPIQCGAPKPAAILEFGFDGDECTVTTSLARLWEVGAAQTTQFYDYSPIGMSCTRSTFGRITTYPQGAAIDVASLPKLQVLQVGTGALRLPYYGVGNVPYFPVSNAVSFTDAASGHLCRPFPFADGTWRCVPSTFPRVADYDLYYQSADCTGELVYPWYRSNVCPTSEPEPRGIIVQLFGCGVPVSQTLAFDGISSTPGPVYHRTPSVACQDFGVHPQSGAKLFKATKVVNPAELFIPFERKLSD